VSLVARAKGYVPTSHLVSNVPPAGTLTDVVISLSPGAVIAGKVLTDANTAIPDAKIYIGGVPTVDSAENPVTVSGPDGAFTIDSIGSADIALTALHPDYAPNSVTVTPNPIGPTPVEIHLQPGGRVEGTARQGRRPLPGYTVMIRAGDNAPQARSEAITDAAGHFVIRGLQGGLVAVTLSGEAGAGTVAAASNAPIARGTAVAVTVEAEVQPGGVTIVDFDVPEGTAVVEGLLTRYGQPLPDIHLDALAIGLDNNTWRFDATADNSGYYRLAALPAGTLTLHVDYLDEENAWHARIVRVPVVDGQTARCDVEVEGHSRITGVVRGGGGVGDLFVVALWGAVDVTLQGVRDFSSLEHQMAGIGDVQPDGSFDITGLDEGTYTVLSVVLPSGGQRTTLRTASAAVKIPQNGEANVELTLP
jgi:hypothetical protein